VLVTTTAIRAGGVNRSVGRLLVWPIKGVGVPTAVLVRRQRSTSCGNKPMT
jgi:hypothetical protein